MLLAPFLLLMLVYVFVMILPLFVSLFLNSFILWSLLSYVMPFFFVFCFFFSFCCLISGSHHSGSPLARGARYCMSADSSKVYTIPQTSSSGPELVQGSGLGPGSEACGQARTQSSCKFTVGAKATDDDDDDDDAAHSTEEPPNISECG